MLKVVPSVIAASFFPAISAMNRASGEAYALCSRILRYQLVSSVVLSASLCTAARWTVLHTYAISEAVEVLQLLVWTLIPVSLYSTLIYFFFQAGLSHLSVRILGVALAVNLLLNYFLIPSLGTMALAMSSLVSESLCLVLFFGFYLSRAPLRESVLSHE